MEVTPAQLRAFITGRADLETQAKITADLSKQDSKIRRVLDGMRLAAEDVLNVEWNRLLQHEASVARQFSLRPEKSGDSRA